MRIGDIQTVPDIFQRENNANTLSEFEKQNDQKSLVSWKIIIIIRKNYIC